jgi:predicted house-cleaning NTP pyrophosphatase (Maf/HAM1 superfamily)
MLAPRSVLLSATFWLTSACSMFRAPPPPDPAPGVTAVEQERAAGLAAAVARERAAVAARDSANATIAVLGKRVSLLELRLLEKDAQVEDLQSRLDETRTAVVKARSQVQMANGRAGAASGMAEAEVALRSLRAVAPPQYPDVQQASRLLRQSAGAFDKKNYGGAIFLAGQAKTVALTATSRLGAGNRLRTARTGEAPFAVPLRLKVIVAGSVRDRPGVKSPVVFPVEVGVPLTGLSYVDEWIRVTDDRRRTGWVNRSMVGRR